MEDVEKILENEIAFHPGPHELVWINGNIDNGQVEVHSSLLQSKSDLIFSPLVGDLVDVMNGSSLENVSLYSTLLKVITKFPHHDHQMYGIFQFHLLANITVKANIW